MSVTVYTKPVCPGCNQTKKYLKENNVAYKEVDLSQDIDALNMIKEMGYRQVPVVFFGDNHWSGYRQDKLKDIVEVYGNA